MTNDKKSTTHKHTRTQMLSTKKTINGTTKRNYRFNGEYYQDAVFTNKE